MSNRLLRKFLEKVSKTATLARLAPNPPDSRQIKGGLAMAIGIPILSK
jgi:hypothetical protein